MHTSLWRLYRIALISSVAGWRFFWKALGYCREFLDLHVVVSQDIKGFAKSYFFFLKLLSDSQWFIQGLASIRTALVTCWCIEAGTFLDLGLAVKNVLVFPCASGHHLGTKVKFLRKHCKRQDLAVYWPRIRSVYP